MANPKSMRVSDEERQRAVDALSRALATDRIDHEEFEARVARALAAESYVELGDVVVDLPVRAPRPPPEPRRYDYLPINARSATAADAQRIAGEGLDPRQSRSRAVVVMSLRAALVLAAAGIVDVMLLADVLPSASPIEGVGVILIAVLVTLLAIFNAVACRAAIPRKLNPPRSQ